MVFSYQNKFWRKHTIRGDNRNMKLVHKKAIITGAGRGLGEAIAGHFVREGASVFLCARSEQSLHDVKEKLSVFLKDGQEIHTKPTDISNARQVDELVNEAVDKFKNIDILVNNAGIYGPLGEIEDNDWDEWVDAININLLGTVYFCRALIPHMKGNKYGKIINLSGGGATSPLPRISAYAASKAAIVRFVETLALEVQEYNIDVNSIAPGALATKLNEQLLEAGPEAVGEQFFRRISKLLESGGTPLSKGAELAVYLASAESDGITGRLISAPWDPWPTLHEHKEEIADSDIYTLRRIIPKERGMDWGDV